MPTTKSKSITSRSTASTIAAAASSYVPPVSESLPPTRPAAMIRIPKDAFASKSALAEALRAYHVSLTPALPSQRTPAQSKLGKTLTAAAVAAAGSDGAPLKPGKRSRSEQKIQAETDASTVPTYKPVAPIYREQSGARAGRPVKTQPRFHWT